MRIVAPRVDETVLDPACGSGAFLVHALPSRVRGVDQDPRAVRVARALLLLAGASNAHVTRGNSLADPLEPADVILTNPPFAGDVQEASLLANYALHRPGHRTERDVLFLERCVTLLRPGGRMAIVLPQNKMGARRFDGVREWLLRNVRVVSVLALGRNTFVPHTTQKACVVFGIRRARPLPWVPSNESILFLVSEKDGKDTGGRILSRPDARPDDPFWVRVDHDLDAAVARFRTFVKDQEIPWGERP